MGAVTAEALYQSFKLDKVSLRKQGIVEVSEWE
jgi:hypothetical protein